MKTTKNLPYKIINGYKIFYNNEASVTQTINEIFSNKHYNFKSNKTAPTILDCGSNIGIATIFFKMQYPDAKITCFEPDPLAFVCLKQNIAANNLKDVTPINAALSAKKGIADFFGQVNMNNPDSRGNSTNANWGSQRKISNSIKVQTVKLSDHITHKIDFLKLDVEGAEQEVLNELGDKLHLIEEAIIEVHIADQIQSFNDMKNIINLLKKYEFTCNYKKQNAECIWPEAIKNWVNKYSPELYLVHALRHQTS